ncbi:mannitol dehydrogenase family protein [Geminicoccaceae bacterium 1502E]|nr:mannitol dehydrogenase family protein [Geminicoccaceae bacterium 1502E]
MVERLSESVLGRLPACVERPAYDRGAVRTGIVHLGIGAFHRAHQAVYTDAVLAAGDRRWGICGVSLRSPATRDALGPQDGLYTLAVRSGEGERLRVVGAVRELLVAPEQPEALLARLCAADTRIVSLTVTEKGYCHDPATGNLDGNHPDIRHDLAEGSAPRSAPGLLVEALRRRRAEGLEPFTVLCCDNLPENGATVGRIVAQLAGLRDPALGRFVREEVAFPCTMVDRIVPATTDADRAAVDAALGAVDAWPVVAEPFSQWVIEDRFPAGRPAWEEHGAMLVEDVRPFEHMKLRCLNGAHSSIAYLGFLAGHETVADAMADADLARFIGQLWAEELVPSVPPPPGVDLADYTAALARRFANPALRHRTAQIAMDGSQKLPQRLLAPARDLLAKGRQVRHIALAVAAWMRFVSGRDEVGRPIELSDPLAGRLRAIAEEAGPVAGRLAPALLAVREVFEPALADDPRFRDQVSTALGRLLEQGVRRTLAEAGGAHVD